MVGMQRTPPSSKRLDAFAAALGIVLCTASALPGPAAADALPRYELSGFGTLGAARLDVDGAEYRTGAAQDGARTTPSLEPDSRLGLQLDAELTPRWRAGVQLLAREGPDGDVEAGVERGYLRVALGEWSGLRVGRLALPVFGQSEYRYVGYANTLVRPPEELYALLPFGRYDGADLIVQREVGSAFAELQILIGESREELYEGIVTDADMARGVNASLERGPLRLRASWLATHVRVSAPGLAPLTDALARLPPTVPGLQDTVNALSRERRRVAYTTFGLRLDLDPLVIEAEYARRTVSPDLAIVPDAQGWYLSIARRVGRFTPYAFLASFDEDEVGLPLGLPSGVPQLDVLQAAVDSTLPELDQDTAGLGVRWEAAPGVALKLQAERVRREVFGISFSRGTAVEGDPGTDATLLSAALDFVF